MDTHIGKHRKGTEYHRMEFWQASCLWYAHCACGGRGCGYDGAMAMEAIQHSGPGEPARPLMGYETTKAEVWL